MFTCLSLLPGVHAPWCRIHSVDACLCGMDIIVDISTDMLNQTWRTAVVSGPMRCHPSWPSCTRSRTEPWVGDTLLPTRGYRQGLRRKGNRRSHTETRLQHTARSSADGRQGEALQPPLRSPRLAVMADILSDRPRADAETLSPYRHGQQLPTFMSLRQQQLSFRSSPLSKSTAAAAWLAARISSWTIAERKISAADPSLAEPRAGARASRACRSLTPRPHGRPLLCRWGQATFSLLQGCRPRYFSARPSRGARCLPLVRQHASFLFQPTMSSSVSRAGQ